MKTLKTILLASLLAVITSTATMAETYTWSRYDLTFELPNGGLVTYNSGTIFEVRWVDLSVVIRLYDNTGVGDDEIKYNLRKSASGYNMFDTQMRKSKIKGFKGYNLTGTLPDGSHACLTNVASKKSNLLLAIEINYLIGSEDIVSNILDSFVEGKKQKTKKEKTQQKIQKEGEPLKPIKPGTTEADPPAQLYDI